MKSDRANTHVQRRLTLPVVAAIAVVSVLTLGIADASAARGGGGARAAGGGGRMAHSSIAGASRPATRPAGGNVDRGNINTGNVNRGNINSGNINTGNINRVNVNVGNDVNINIDRGYGYHGGVRYPIAAGVAIGAMAVTTAAVLGSYYYALPPSCTMVVRVGVSYHYCGNVYYQQTWSGNDVVYVVVNP